MNKSYLFPKLSQKDRQMVDAWIATHSEHSWDKKRKPDCMHCGWPHSPNLLCGAHFGMVKLGGQYTYIDSSNVEFMIGFVNQLNEGGAFHWCDQIFFQRTSDGVQVRHIEYFNHHPSVKCWDVPSAEWKTIVEQMGRLPRQRRLQRGHTRRDR